MDHCLKQSARLQRLSKLAHEVRQVAINRPDDLEGWRVSRLLRDASTPAEADEAERQFGTWERAINTLPHELRLNLTAVAEARKSVIAQAPQVIASLDQVIPVTDKNRQLYAASRAETKAGADARRQAQFQILSRTEKLAQIGGWELDIQSKTLSWTPGVFRVLGLPYGPTPDFATALSLLEAHSQTIFKEKILKSLAQQGEFDFEVSVKSSSASIQLFGIWVNAETGLRVYGIISKNREKAESDLVWELSNHDALTGLPNRALFEKRLQNVLVQAAQLRTKIAVVAIDLDNLKQTNDALGHAAGDTLLRAVGERLKLSIRPNDMVARLGGDEFCVVLTGLSDSLDITGLVETIHGRLHNPVERGSEVLSCGASVGIAIFPEHGTNSESLQANADIALGAAKSIGRGSICLFSPEMRKRLERRMRGVANARKATEQGQIVPFYQPQVHLKTGAVTGFEALLRWKHPTRGILPPSEISDAFEDRELACALGENLLHDILDDINNWSARKIPFGRIAFNAARMELIRPRYASDLLHQVELAGIDPRVLEVEVHENALAGRGSDRVEESIRELSRAGVMIALDDFGTGFGSLSHLRRLPVNVVKIDRSFVQSMQTDIFARAIIDGLIKITGEMNLRLVAEGVETLEEASYLENRNCDIAQGFYFAPAMPAEEVETFLQKQKLKLRQNTF